MPRKKKEPLCNGDCFNCPYDDCINDEDIAKKAHKAEYDAQYHKTEKFIKQNKINCKTRYNRLKEAGVCVTCGSKPATHGIFCFECWIKAKQRNARRPRNPRKEGKCFYCDQPSIPGKKTCEKHYAECVEKMKRCRESAGFNKHKEAWAAEYWGVKKRDADRQVG